MESSTARPRPSGPRVRARSPTCWRSPPSATATAPTVRYKADGEWRDVSYREVGEIVSRDRPRAASTSASSPATASRCCADTRPSGPTRTSRSRAAGGVVVPVYPTNSPEECAWVAGNSEARAIVCEDAEQVAKIARRPRPAARARDDRRRSTPPARRADAVSLDELRERGRDARPRRAARARRGGRARRPVHVHLHVRARPGRRRAACSRTATTATCSSMCEAADVIDGDDVVYLFLPLAHSYALLIQLLAVDLGATLAYWQRRPEADRRRADGGPARRTCRRCRASSRRSTRSSRRDQGDPEKITQAARPSRSA